jgi:hypothetical protein
MICENMVSKVAFVKVKHEKNRVQSAVIKRWG